MAFKIGENSYDIAIAGFGQVGRAFARILAEEAPRTAKTEPSFRVIGLHDSTGGIVDEGGISWPRLVELARAKDAGTGLAALAMPGSAGSPAPGGLIHVELGPTDVITGGMSGQRILDALRRGAAIVSSSKGAFVAQWEQIEELARLRGLPVRFSATVGAGMPIIEAGRALAQGSTINGLRACLNGTSSFVLGLMEEGMSLEAAVKRAQQMGMAEADPSADLDGHDAAAKLCILARAVLGIDLRHSEVRRTSVREATSARIAAAAAKGLHLRSVARLAFAEPLARRGLSASVQLEEVPATGTLAVKGAGCAIIFETSRSGELALSGVGAGPVETASAVLRDLRAVVRGLSFLKA